jgi:DNA-binding GntR family transcriptional regulator
MAPLTHRERITAALRSGILDGSLRPGERLPSLAKLAERHGVTEIVSRAVYADLAAEGLVEGRKGAGYFVRPAPAPRDLRRWYRRGDRSPFAAEQRSAGRTPSWQASSRVVEAPEAVSERLGLRPGAQVVETAYLFLADGRPSYLSTSWEPYSLTGGTPVERPEEGKYAGYGVVDRMAVIGVECTSAIEKNLARPSTAAEADRLSIPLGSPVLHIERTLYAGDRPVETANIVAPQGLQSVYHVPVQPEG